MSKARLVLIALFIDHQSPAEVAARYGVHRAWVYRLRARYEAEGEAAFEPRSRSPQRRLLCRNGVVFLPAMGPGQPRPEQPFNLLSLEARFGVAVLASIAAASVVVSHSLRSAGVMAIPARDALTSSHDTFATHVS